MNRHRPFFGVYTIKRMRSQIWLAKGWQKHILFIERKYQSDDATI